MSVPVRSVLRAAYKGVALAAAMPQGFLLDALAALLSGVDSDMNDVEGIRACSIVCVSVFLFERIDA